jgi:hypothetical protein
LTGLENLNSVGGDLRILNIEGLTSLSGLNNLSIVEGSLVIQGCLNLINLNGLENLSTISDVLSISENISLMNLSGLENLNGNTIQAIWIYLNESLSDCEIQAICDYVANSPGANTIYDNSPGCDSFSELEEACEDFLVDEQISNFKLSLFPNPAIQDLKVSAEGFTIDKLVIYTLTGQPVMKTWQQGNSIDISFLPSGMYIVEVVIEGNKFREKLLVD